MSTMPYSSKDFGATKAEPEVDVPERLIHRGVEAISLERKFSEERKHPVFVVDLPSKTISMTIGHLESGKRSREHRHTYETMLYVLEGEGQSVIEGKAVSWRAGDAVYVPVWAWHYHENLGKGLCRYLACENAPLLQNLGNVALREER